MQPPQKAAANWRKKPRILPARQLEGTSEAGLGVGCSARSVVNGRSRALAMEATAMWLEAGTSLFRDTKVSRLSAYGRDQNCVLYVFNLDLLADILYGFADGSLAQRHC